MTTLSYFHGNKTSKSEEETTSVTMTSTTNTSRDNPGVVHPPTIQEIFKKSLWSVFWKHMRVDHDNRRWELFATKGQSIEQLFRKCKLVLSCVYAPDELDMNTRTHNLLTLLIDQCKLHFRDTFVRRQTFGY